MEPRRKRFDNLLVERGKTGPNNNPSACPFRECSSSTLSLFSPLFIWLCPFFTLLFLYDPFSSSPPFLPSLFSSSSYQSSHSIPNLLCLLLCLILLFSSVFLLFVPSLFLVTSLFQFSLFYLSFSALCLPLPFFVFLLSTFLLSFSFPSRCFSRPLIIYSCPSNVGNMRVY